MFHDQSKYKMKTSVDAVNWFGGQYKHSSTKWDLIGLIHKSHNSIKYQDFFLISLSLFCLLERSSKTTKKLKRCSFNSRELGRHLGLRQTL